MKLYRIRCVSDGKFFNGGSDKINDWRVSGTGHRWRDTPKWSKDGVFFKTEETIRRHLHNLCCVWVDDETKNNYYRNHTMAESGPNWDKLDDYQVDCLIVLDSDNALVPAAEFMNMVDVDEQTHKDAVL